MTTQRNKTKRGKRGLKKEAGPSDFNKKRTRLVLYNNVPQLPDEYDTVITSGFNFDNAGATAAVTGFLATNSLLNTSHSGATVNYSAYLDELVRLYESYRVVAYALDYHWVSRSATASNWLMVHTNEDPAFATGSSFALSALSYPNMFHLIVPGTGLAPSAGKVKCNKQWLADVVGTDTFASDDSYAGTVSTSGVFTAPSALTYTAYYAGLITGAAYGASNSPYVSGRLFQFVKFYGRRA